MISRLATEAEADGSQTADHIQVCDNSSSNAFVPTHKLEPLRLCCERPGTQLQTLKRVAQHLARAHAQGLLDAGDGGGVDLAAPAS